MSLTPPAMPLTHMPDWAVATIQTSEGIGFLGINNEYQREREISTSILPPKTNFKVIKTKPLYCRHNSSTGYAICFNHLVRVVHVDGEYAWVDHLGEYEGEYDQPDQAVELVSNITEIIIDPVHHLMKALKAEGVTMGEDTVRRLWGKGFFNEQI